MFVTGVRQPVTPAVTGNGLYSEAQGVNFTDAGQGESSLEGCAFES
jgi:hypothetical protein